MSIIAIDPGAQGGVAVFENNSAYVFKMPDTVGDLIEELRTISERNDTLTVYLESLVKHMGGGIPASTMAVYAPNHGAVTGACQALKIRLISVRPQEWQPMFHLGTSRQCKNKGAWKNRLKAEAQRRYPSLKITLQTADALLMLEWAKSKTNAAGLVSV